MNLLVYLLITDHSEKNFVNPGNSQVTSNIAIARAPSYIIAHTKVSKKSSILHTDDLMQVSVLLISLNQILTNNLHRTILYKGN